MATDRRQLNQVSMSTNPHGETFIYGRIGTGKNSIIVTLQYVNKGENKNVLRSRWENRIGERWSDIKKDTRGVVGRKI